MLPICSVGKLERSLPQLFKSFIANVLLLARTRRGTSLRSEEYQVKSGGEACREESGAYSPSFQTARVSKLVPSSSALARKL